MPRRDVVRPGSPDPDTFQSGRVQNEIAPNYETKPRQSLNTKLVHHSTLYKIARRSRWFRSTNLTRTADQFGKILDARE
jgi:hypothetical protein